MGGTILTLLGCAKEFSSFTLLDVITVFDDPNRCTVFESSPSIETFRFTEMPPKFTACKKQQTHAPLYINKKDSMIVSYKPTYLDSYVIFLICWAFIRNCRCNNWWRRGTEIKGCIVINCSTWFGKELLHPITRSSICLWRIKHYSIWVPSIYLYKKTDGINQSIK